jgi:hypothetical protein
MCPILTCKRVGIHATTHVCVHMVLQDMSGIISTERKYMCVCGARVSQLVLLGGRLSTLQSRARRLWRRTGCPLCRSSSLSIPSQEPSCANGPASSSQLGMSLKAQIKWSNTQTLLAEDDNVLRSSETDGLASSCRLNFPVENLGRSFQYLNTVW